MNRHTFINGGHVLHRVRLAGYTSKFSAWYTATGELVDADRIDILGRSFEPSERQRDLLAKLGADRFRHNSSRIMQ